MGMDVPELPITFRGNVISGAGRGKEMGIPTLNINLAAVPSHLAYGIYAGRAWLPSGEEYIASIHFGPAPVFDEGPSFEVHILDAEIPLAPDKIEIELAHFLRDVMDFNSKEELVAQIQKDIEQTRAIMRIS